jgi:hypothetical protein
MIKRTRKTLFNSFIILNRIIPTPILLYSAQMQILTTNNMHNCCLFFLLW